MSLAFCVHFRVPCEISFRYPKPSTCYFPLQSTYKSRFMDSLRPNISLTICILIRFNVNATGEVLLVVRRKKWPTTDWSWLRWKRESKRQKTTRIEWSCSLHMISSSSMTLTFSWHGFPLLRDGRVFLSMATDLISMDLAFRCSWTRFYILPLPGRYSIALTF